MKSDINSFMDKLCRYKNISIIGLEKNTGKTTMLNFLIDKLRGRKIGITSIGRDGEEKDAVTFTNKPRIYIDKGTLVATSKYSFLKSDAEFEILSVMDVGTSLGNIVIGRSLYPGFVEIAGASTATQTKQVIDTLQGFGSEIVLVDGALSRKSVADPSITKASVLCTGAAFSKDPDTIVDETLSVLKIFSLKKASAELSKLYEENMKQCRIAYVYDNSVKKSGLKTSIGASREIISNLSHGLKFIFLKGALTDSIVKDILEFQSNIKPFIFVIENPTKCLLDGASYDKFIKKGGRIEVKNTTEIIGICINPVSPSGYILDSRYIIERLRDAAGIPVFDVMDYDWKVIR